MKFKRAAGVILHPTSLPGIYGIGDIGPQAHRWLEFLSEADCSLWQVLPLGPTGYGDSPYQCFSAFAGNPYLISPVVLRDEGLLNDQDLDSTPPFSQDRVDYGWVIPWKIDLLNRAYDHFLSLKDSHLIEEFDQFQIEQSAWLDDFAIFMALKETHGGDSWSTWSRTLRRRESGVIQKASKDLATAIRRQKFRQFLFFNQWEKLHAHAQALDIQIIGDIPIFVAHDSADVWANPDLFYLDEEGSPTVVAGVPPDYFSPTGQLWGNPLYRWELHKQRGYSWWIDRFRAVLQLVDIVRLDHFRGFAAYWEVPAGNPTAEQGRWVPGPGKDIFHTIQKSLNELPIIAEDLGVITPDVEELRDAFGLPGMKVLQFGLSDSPQNMFLPHHYITKSVAYTGTHDNDTSLGWFESASEKVRAFTLRYLAANGVDISWDMLRAIWASVAMFSLATMQDLLSLGCEGRMNFPGKPSGNWTWRMKEDDLADELCERLQDLNYLYSRANPVEKQSA